MSEIVIDRYDLQLLAALQRQGQATNAELGEKANLGVIAYAQVILERHDKTRASDFERQVSALPEVLECFAVTGEADYMLRIVAPDLAAFSDLMMKKLLTLPGVAQVKTNIALSKIKQTHELPLGHVAHPQQPKRRVRFKE